MSSGHLSPLIVSCGDQVQHLRASSSWTGTGASLWQEEHLALQRPQDSCVESMLGLHNGRDRERREEDLCVSGTTKHGGLSAHIRSGTRAQRIQVWPSHAVLGSSTVRLTMSSILVISSSSSWYNTYIYLFIDTMLLKTVCLNMVYGGCIFTLTTVSR